MDYSGQEENFRNKIYSEFKRIDEFVTFFRDEFVDSLYEIVTEYYHDVERDNVLVENLALYANEMISTAESVIYKDKSYSAYRIKEELVAMTRVVVKEPTEDQDPEFIEKIHQKAKELMVQHYPNIIELSGDGFRLLEKYARMYNWEFITNFYAEYYVNSADITTDD